MTDSANNKIARKLRIARYLNWACYSGLMLLFAVWNLFLPGGSLKWWLLQTFPLLLVLPGLLKGHYRSYLWLCFILLLYITASIVDVMMPGRGWQHGLLLLLSLTLFFSAMMTSRWQRMQ
ncbi:DUF2069 domain-containing protein [Microbulbifer thermotolerans]|uniref:DUF2069 domain-containing protein n=1 Tax=Microbulbifer thermotolerans TaxID=252514 RepID=A0AB35HW20_MICTH|nr:DUF2069 domain-containing protein [Microbulbifer thermotolerans]MCX2778878.1 DUF2069 domain-containing protein [Microbulbifer thermotolerans]MCX2800947.1 DUF2069 domain-containing protein [Microbulbifer thermotolerans]MCX2804183.1 DUF2069 domain-containing protein [Microbulbifer thermotolerans]MCX2830197.1 DUF2069 domain-containing protein [Microbulbifer thermotolerans]MCX2834684.1 DUF2069 domain-containing protein [Microbulbifer thermotolerans]